MIKRSAKSFFLKSENYVDFAARNPLIKQASNTPNSTNNLCSEFAPRNREYSSITEKNNSHSKLAKNNSNSNIQIATANIPHSLFALNRSTDHLPNNLNNFKRIANKLIIVLLMSNSDAKTLTKVKQSKPSKVRFADEAGPSTAPAEQATPSTPNTDTTTVTSPSTDDLYTDAFNFALSKIFFSTLMASLTTKDATLREVRDCILTENEDRYKQILPYIHSFWKDIHVKKECVFIDDRVAIPNAIKDAYVEAIHATHTGSWGMTHVATHAWWPYMHREIITKTAKCNPCVKICKSLKSIIPANKWAPLKLCKVSNDEIQIDFGGPIYNEKNQEVYILACIDRFSKFPTEVVFHKANAANEANSFKSMFWFN